MARIEKGEAGYVATINFNQPAGPEAARLMSVMPTAVGISIITIPAEQVPATPEDPTSGEPSEDQ